MSLDVFSDILSVYIIFAYRQMAPEDEEELIKTLDIIWTIAYILF